MTSRKNRHTLSLTKSEVWNITFLLSNSIYGNHMALYEMCSKRPRVDFLRNLVRPFVYDFDRIHTVAQKTTEIILMEVID